MGLSRRLSGIGGRVLLESRKKGLVRKEGAAAPSFNG